MVEPRRESSPGHERMIWTGSGGDDALRLTEDPNRTILGLANHGILVTGADLEEAWDQIEARLDERVPAGS